MTDGDGAQQQDRVNYDLKNLLSLTPFFVGVALWLVTGAILWRYMGNVGVMIGAVVGIVWIVVGMDLSDYLAKRWNIHE